MQKTNFILPAFILFFLCLTACQTEKKQNATPCALRDFNIENINPDSNTCETNGLCQGQMDSLSFEGKVTSALMGDTLIALDCVLKQQNQNYTTMSFFIDLRNNTLVDSTFYMSVKRNDNNHQWYEIYKLEKNNSISTDCFQYDKQRQIILGSIRKRKFVPINPNPIITIKQIYIPELNFKANTKILKNPCILCG